jgi:hypothetical protein
MNNQPAVTKYQDIPCCPDLETAPICDVIDFRRHLVFPTSLRTEAGALVQVDVVIHTRFTRCPGPLALGEIVKSLTLLPGETVRLATTDRQSRFSFDSETKLSYHSEQISEEQYRMRALRSFMSDENSTDQGGDNYSEQDKWDFHGDASGSIGFLSAGASTNAKGSHNASSTHDYLREHRAHAEMADNQSVEATRKAHSISIGEVSTRAHSQGESEDHFESASREFSNPNACHALTFQFYRINKTETIKFELVSIERRVLDPVAPLPVPANPFRPVGEVAAIPQEQPATSTKRQETLTAAINSDALRRAVVTAPSTPGAQVGAGLQGAAGQPAVATATVPVGTQVPLADDLRAKALQEVDKQLVALNLIDKVGGDVAKPVQDEINYERTTSLPTSGVIVKSCVDDCNICEDEAQRRLTLELDRMELENKLLQRQIDLLDKSQEYRCCEDGGPGNANPGGGNPGGGNPGGGNPGGGNQGKGKG